MIKRYVEEIHTKPESHRRKLTYVVSGVLTLLIGVVWFSSVGYLNNFGNAVADNNTLQVEQTAKKSNSPFAVIGSNLANVYDSVKNALGIKTSDNSSNVGKARLEYVPDNQ